jgi:hypothetical protein
VFIINRYKNITDYARGAFKRTYEEGNAIYYAAFHPEFIDDDGHDRTGKYFVVLLHSSGMYIFHLVESHDKWIVENENLYFLLAKVGEERLQWISDCICKRGM